MNIDFEGLVNARDVGGVPTVDGRIVARGVLYRSETPQLMTGSDVERAWHDLGIGRVVDIRGLERGGSGPIAEGDRGVILDFFGLMGGFETVDPSADGFLPSLLDRGGAPLAAFLEQLLGASGPVLLHCHTGKDRTGFLVAMTLALLGVDDEAIVVDYLRTQPVFDQMIRNLEAIGLGIPDRAPAYAKEPPSVEGIGALLRRLRAEWGQADAWAASQGIDPELVDRVRAHLVTG